MAEYSRPIITWSQRAPSHLCWVRYRDNSLLLRLLLRHGDVDGGGLGNGLRGGGDRGGGRHREVVGALARAHLAAGAEAVQTSQVRGEGGTHLLTTKAEHHEHSHTLDIDDTWVCGELLFTAKIAAFKDLQATNAKLTKVSE